jgi:hypothetical protein
LHTARNASAGVGRAEGGTLPTAGNQGYDTAIIPSKSIYGRIQVSGQVIRAARDNAGAFVTAVESEIRGLTKDMQKSVNRQLLGDGTDALAFATDTDSTTPAPFDDNQGNAFVHLPASGTVVVDIHDASTYARNGDSITVTLGAKGASTYSVGWTGGSYSNAGDGDIMVLEDTWGYQLMGIDGIIGTGDPVPVPALSAKTGLHGLDVATYPWWKSQVFTNSGTKRDLTTALMQEPLSAIAVNSDFSEQDVAFMLCNYNIRDKYVSLLAADKRFPNAMTLDGGFKAVEFNGLPLVPDPQCKRGTIFYIVPEVLKIYRMSDFDWLDKDGSVLSRVSNADAYEATMFMYGDLGCTARNALAKLGDLND